jgi:hypothetical protein
MKYMSNQPPRFVVAFSLLSGAIKERKSPVQGGAGVYSKAHTS